MAPTIDYRLARRIAREWYGVETIGALSTLVDGLDYAIFEQLLQWVETTEPEMVQRVARNAQRRWRRECGLCPECGGDTQDGNCSPLFDDGGVCADCGEARASLALSAAGDGA